MHTWLQFILKPHESNDLRNSNCSNLIYTKSFVSLLFHVILHSFNILLDLINTSVAIKQKIKDTILKRGKRVA
jgi:2-hydroxy-3-keto-5-methylthiopentenyl-1-phosphate phosphatase